MKTNAPRTITLIIALILAIVGIIGVVAKIAFLAPLAFWLVVAGFVVLLAGSLFKGL
jgi:predicted membrane channel-forming protein YqfA (hemolysin III family)